MLCLRITGKTETRQLSLIQHVCSLAWYLSKSYFWLAARQSMEETTFFSSLLAPLALCLSCFLHFCPSLSCHVLYLLAQSPAAKPESDSVKELAVALLGMTPPRSALQTQKSESLMLELYVLFDKNLSRQGSTLCAP